MRCLSALLALALVVPTLDAQKYVYLPNQKGVDLSKTEGNTIFFMSRDRRFQNIDNSILGSARIFDELALRRDKSLPTSSTKGKVEITLEMGDANFAVLSGEMDKNFLPGSRKAVFTKKFANFPNWSIGGTPPYPFDFTLPFDSTYLYLGKQALIWDLTMENNTSALARVDRQYVSYRSGSSTRLGFGCTASDQRNGFRHYLVFQDNGTALPTYRSRARVNGYFAPKNTPVFLAVGGKDGNAPFGLCRTVHPAPSTAFPTVLIFPLGVSDRDGFIWDTYYGFRSSSSTAGATFVTQLFAVDMKQPGGIVLSDGRQAVVALSSSTTGSESAYVWSSVLTVPNRSSFVFVGGSFVGRLRYK